MRHDFFGQLPNGPARMPEALAAGFRKAAERSALNDAATIASRPGPFSKAAATALQAFEKAMNLANSPFTNGAEVTGGNPNFSSEMIPRRQLEEPKASDVEFLWTNPNISADLRAGIAEGRKRLLNYSDDAELRSAYFWGDNSLTPLREAISDLEDRIGSKISVIYRLIGITPETAPGHGEGDATDQDSTPRRTRSLLNPLSTTPQDERSSGIDYDPKKPVKAAGLSARRIDEAYQKGVDSVLAQTRPVPHRITYPQGTSFAKFASTDERARAIDLAFTLRQSHQLSEGAFRDIMKWKANMDLATPATRKNFAGESEVQALKRRIRREILDSADAEALCELLE